MTDNMNFVKRKNDFKDEIKSIPDKVYNKEQKALALGILEHANEHNIDAIFTFITQRIKLGFTFDAAPEVNHGAVSLVKKNDKMSFGTMGNKHKMIIGENYDALKNLLATYTQHGKGLVDVIYIDPPYNTEASKADGNDHKSEDVKASKFMYRDKFTRNGWLNMMRERLVMARKLLSESGVIFISIDDNEQAYLKVLCDEIFGEENFVACVVWECRNPNVDIISTDHEYTLVYAKDKANINPIYKKTNEGYINIENYNWLGRSIVREYKYKDEKGQYRLDAVTTVTAKKAHYTYKIEVEKNIFTECQYEEIDLIDKTKFVGHKYFGRPIDSMKRMINNGNIVFTKDEKTGKYSIKEKKYQHEEPPFAGEVSVIHRKDIKYDDSSKDLHPMGINFPYAKPVEYIKRFIKAKTSSKPNSIILDFFAGSGTTGQAVMELNEEDGGNRQCILVANNENSIGKGVMFERIYRVVNGKGTNGEEFAWEYKKGQKSLPNNVWDIFEIETHELKIDDFEKAEELIVEAEKQFKNLNEDYEHKDFDIYNQLASLNPYKK